MQTIDVIREALAEIAPEVDFDELEADVELRDQVDLDSMDFLNLTQAVADATITVTNLGDQGVDSVTGVIYPPQVALVGFGRIRERPWAINGLIGVRPVVTATLSADHRASVGHRGAIFLSVIDRLLQEPERLR